MAIGILKSSVQSLYILLLKDDRPLYSGTAIVVMSQFGPLLVTSRHLVTGKNQDTQRILSPSGITPNQVKIAHNRRDELGEWVIREEKLYDENGTPRWTDHPRLRASANIVALPLQDVFDVEFFPYDLVNIGPDLVVGLTDPVSIIGYPFGLRGGLSFPVWANGFIASEPAVDQFDLPTFLIDCRSRPGQAGSAVVAHSNGGSMIRSGGEYKQFNGPVTKLLGIFGGRVNKESDLGIVWRLSAVREVVESMGNTITQNEQQDSSAEQAKPAHKQYFEEAETEHEQHDEAGEEAESRQTSGRVSRLFKGFRSRQ